MVVNAHLINSIEYIELGVPRETSAITAEELSGAEAEYDAAGDVKVKAAEWILMKQREYGGDGRLDYYGN